jgi:CRP-like cAMP-binding protein
MFFGSLLVLIATELLCEWLIFTHSKMMLYEYAVCLLTFVCIQMVGIEVGMLLGVIAAMFCFVISYSNLQSVSAVTVKSSTVIRTFEERSVLIANRGKVLTVSLSGYLFFGSAVKLLQEIKSKLAASDCDDEPSSISPGADGYLPISTFLGTLKDPAASASLSPPPSVPKLLSRGSLGGALPSLIDAAPTASTNKGNNGNSSAFTEMNPLIAISKQSSFKSPSRQDQVPALVGSASSQAPASYQQQQQLRVGHTHADEATASSHHPMKMLFSSHSLRQKHIPTVYDLSAEQIQSHYQSWTNSSRPLYERNFDPRDCRTDLEMGNLSHQQMSSIPRTTTSDRCNDTLIKDSILTTPVNERTSLLTAAINNSYSKEAAGKTRDTATPKSQHRELIDAQEIRETSVFLQVWESQQQRKEQQRRRQSYSDLVGLSSSLGNREQLDTVDRIKIGLGYNFDSEENLEDLNKTPCENSEIDSNENGHESASKGFSIKSNADPIASGKIRQSTTYTSPVPLTQPMQGMLQAPPSHIAVNAQSQDMVTEYLILDFTEVIGVDATAARACFLTLVHFMRTANVTVVFANLSKPVQELLCAHNVLNEESIIIPNLDDALEWCEDQILVDNKLRDDTEVGGSMISRTRSVEDYSRAWTERQQHLHFNRSTRVNYNDISPGPMKLKNPGSSIDLLSLTEGFSSAGKPISARALRHILVDYLGMDLSNPSNRFRELLESSVLTKFFTREEVNAGEIIFDIDFPATKVFFIESGVVEIVSLTIEQSFETAVTEPKIGRNNSSEVVRVNKASHGGVFGEADFILGKTRSVRAYSVTNCTFWILDREHFAAMEVQQPQLCMLIQYALLRSLALSYTCSMYALHPMTAYADTGDDM